MISNTSSAGFEYKNKHSETPFETFLRYTDEKAKSSFLLASLLEDSLVDNSSILDIGTGNGEYLKLALSNIEALPDIDLTLIEPSDDFTRQLPGHFNNFLLHRKLHIVHATFDAFSTEEEFDIILASHLFYHLPRSTWPEQLAKMVGLLRTGGRLIIVLREQDDAYDFKTAFKPRLFNESFKALTLNDVLAVLPDEQPDIARRVVDSTLEIPIDENLDDTVSIIEFYLNKLWLDIPQTIQREALQFIRDRNGIFHQRDGVAIITK